MTVAVSTVNTASVNTAYAALDRRAYRLTSIDMLRGLVIIIMALDHVRDFVMLGAVSNPMSDPNVNPFLFFTRWITHFCAPVFVFLAGASAGLMAARKSPSSLAAFLVKRGLWIIFIEVAVISTAITFSPFGVEQAGGRTLIMLRVLWVIGASMVVLAGAQFLGMRACLIMGLTIVLGHNLLDAVWPAGGMVGTPSLLWISLHSKVKFIAGQFLILIGYPLLPWMGVMLMGYGAAGIFQSTPERRNSQLLGIGIGLIAAFVLLRILDVYGDRNGWHLQLAGVTATIMDFLNTTKYPPSLLYLLMTLGPAALVCANADRFKGWTKDTLVMFGRAPFVFYIAHFYLAHALALALGVYQGFTVRQMMTDPGFNPKGFGVELPGVYVMWLLVIVLLYPLCRWIAAVKRRRTDWWLSYL